MHFAEIEKGGKRGRKADGKVGNVKVKKEKSLSQSGRKELGKIYSYLVHTGEKDRE